MPNHAAVNASLVRLLHEGAVPADQLTPAGAPAAGGGAAAKVGDVVKDHVPQELFTHKLGWNLGSIDLQAHTHIADLLKEMQTAEQAINDHAAQLGWVGDPTGPFSASTAGGYYRFFANATIYWTSTWGAKEVHGAIRDRYYQMGAEYSYLGFPETDELRSTPPGGEEVRYSNFQGGTIFWTATKGAFLTPSFDPITERHQLGAWLSMQGTGFTPNSRVSFWIVNAPNPPESQGSEYAAGDGRIGYPQPKTVVDLRFLPGDHPPSVARAVDEATGQVADYQLSLALY